ncbi:hypothetical protein SAMN05660772_01828 [Pasteurella testudinis DSM 23072]|uniref:Lipoprotein n=1 Tax=Pasteurella testudinis DSM 23072 TaxID=1122938 RepID=A0A1W1UK01_9PAST|nr:hypothetical protein [Pasteurella testudinis]SMB81369.1 hypothetical protein SAMN05660772_01828 [Pasteurella testudinis DSM 23072]SUB51385.1 Uncharacterised protein [Pasteurella testudinis]
MKKLVLLGLLSLFLASCAGTAPVPEQLAKNIPPERVLAYQEYNPEYAKVTIIRDSGFQGGGCYLGVMYRQTILARFDTSEKAVFYIPEGDWPFAVTADPYGKWLCYGSFNPLTKTQQIRKDKENLFRISLNPWRMPQLIEVSGKATTATKNTSLSNTLNSTKQNFSSTKKVNTAKRTTKTTTLKRIQSSYGPCPCSIRGSACYGPRGGRYCYTSGGNKRYF